MFEACDASPSLDRLHPMPTFQQKLVELCYLVGPSIYQHFTFLQTATYFTCFFVVKNNAVQYRSDVQWCRLIWAML